MTLLCAVWTAPSPSNNNGDHIHLLYLKWITNRDLLYSTRNSVQCYVASWMGGEFAGEGIHVYVWLSPFTIHRKQHYLSISCVCACMCACARTRVHAQLFLLQYKIKSLKKINKNAHRYKNLVEELMQKKRLGRDRSDD